MAICNLCKSNEADQTGSHITSAFLLASQIGKRGEEKGYLITTIPEQDYSENRGDKELKEDYILCRDCELKLSVIENIFSAEITNKIEKENFKANFNLVEKENFKYLICNRINPITFHLMMYSIFWRASISTLRVYLSFKLPDETEEELRFFLDLFLPTVIDHKIFLKTSEWEKMVEKCQDIFSYFPYYISKAENLEDKSVTFEFFDNLSNSPYNIMINEYIILPFLTGIEFNDDFFEIKDKICLNDSLNNSYEHIKVNILSNEEYLSVIEMTRDLGVKLRLEEIENECIAELNEKGLPIVAEVLKSMILEKVEKIKFELN